jgi:hypothetical protein
MRLRKSKAWLVAIYAVVFSATAGGKLRIFPMLGIVSPVAEFSPMVSAKDVVIRDNPKDGQIRSLFLPSLGLGVCCYPLRGIGPEAIREYLGISIGEKYPPNISILRADMRGIHTFEMRSLRSVQNFNHHHHLNIFCHGLACIHNLKWIKDGLSANDLYLWHPVCRGLYFDVKPCALIVPHYFKLATSDAVLVNGGYSERQSEGSETPIGKGAAFDEFAKSHTVLLFLASLGIGVLGGLPLIFGDYYFAIQEPNLPRFLLCALCGAVAFALVFALAHACYG